jgi:hypothetical protein
MIKYPSSSKNLLKQLMQVGVISSVCLLAFTAHAAFVAESHACTNTSGTGVGGIGNNYFPGSRITVTHQVNETFSKKLTIQADLTAYPEGAGDPKTVRKIAYSSPGIANNSVMAWYTDGSTSPGHLLSINVAFTAGMMRWGGTYIAPNAPIEANGCKNKLVHF